MLEKTKITQHFDRFASQRSQWFKKNHIYHQQIIEACKLFITPNTRVLELGCSVGNLIAELKPAYAVGVDISPASIEEAAKNYPQYRWICGDVENLPEELFEEEAFDIIIVEDLTAYLTDVQRFLQNIRRLMSPKTRLVISTWNWMWEPVLRLAESLGLKTPDIRVRQNWISAQALINFLNLSSYEILELRPGLLFPYDISLVSETINLFSKAPLLSNFSLLTTMIAAPLMEEDMPKQSYSVSVIIPTRNEAGNIESLVQQLPEMGSHTELIFVDGSSTDGTIEEIQRVIREYPKRDIQYIPQVPDFDPNTPPNLMLKLGKGDAVRKGFAAAKGDILMILDSDISVLPQDMPLFYEALASGKAQFANGSRFVYSQEIGAMKPLNKLGNIFFSLLFSWLLEQRITDTLCGTKVLFKKDYEAITRNRAYFGDFDPFGDFDLLFGAAWLQHSIIEVPVRYQARSYGESKVKIKTHGPLLGRMSLIGLWQLKIRPLLFGKARPKAKPPVAQASFSLKQIAVLGSFFVILLFVLRWLLRLRK